MNQSLVNLKQRERQARDKKLLMRRPLQYFPPPLLLLGLLIPVTQLADHRQQIKTVKQSNAKNKSTPPKQIKQFILERECVCRE